MLDSTKKKYPMSKDKEVTGRWGKSTIRFTITIKIKSHSCWVADPQTEEQQYQTSSPTVINVLNPTSGFPAWGSNKGTRNIQGTWPWSTVEFDYRTSTGLGVTETLILEGTNKTLYIPGPGGKEQWPHRWLNPNYLLLLDFRLVLIGADHKDRGIGNSSPGSP